MLLLLSLFLVLGRFKWSTGNTLRASIWLKGIPEVGNLSTSLLHHISYFLYHYIRYLVLHRTHLSVASSISRHCENSCNLHEVSHPGIIRLLFLAKHLEVCTNTVCRHAAGCPFSSSSIGSCWDCICLSSLDRSQIHRWTSCSMCFTMDITGNVGLICHVFKEVQTDMGGIFDAFIPLCVYNLETCSALSSNGMV